MQAVYSPCPCGDLLIFLRSKTRGAGIDRVQERSYSSSQGIHSRTEGSAVTMLGRGSRFLSAYMNIPGDRRTFRFRHDQSIALWEVSGSEVRLRRVWELERVTGQKHHYLPLYQPGLAVSLIEQFLDEEGIALEDVDGIWGTPGLPRSVPVVKPPGASGFALHALSHLFSGIMLDSQCFESDTIFGLAVDGGPDYVIDDAGPLHWYVGCVSREGKIAYYPVESPGQLWLAASRTFSMEPGSLMALATATSCDLEFDVDAYWANRYLFGKLDVFPHPAIPAQQFVDTLIDVATRRGLRSSSGDEVDRWCSNDLTMSAVMKTVSRASELIVARNIRMLEAESGMATSGAYLSMTGGFALNCPSNSSMLKQFGFKGLLSPPCPNDSGQALGIGLMQLYSSGALTGRQFKFENAFYGSPRIRLKESCEAHSQKIRKLSKANSGEFVKDIIEGPVAYVSGAAELGPRALGHRSLLGDPRSHEVKDALNTIKRRQWWRPVAPIVLLEHVEEWFDDCFDSPYMLEIGWLKPSKRRLVPAVAHLDGTARVQTIDHATDAGLYSLISAFYDQTGVPMLCNTSLNEKGEPIVNDAGQALTFCIRRGVRVAYVDSYRVEVENDRNWSRSRRNFRFLDVDSSDVLNLWNSWPEDLTDRARYMLTRMPNVDDVVTNAMAPALNDVAEAWCEEIPGLALVVDGFTRSLRPDPGERSTAWEGVVLSE